MDQDELADLEDFLRSAWKAQFGRPPATLTGDLDRLKDLFKTGASAKRLRESVNGLPKVTPPRLEVPEAVFISIEERRGLVTPEGRILLEELVRIREEGSQVLSREAVVRATSIAARTYGTWQREWLTQRVSGTGLRPGTYGFVLLLLINGSTTADRGLRVPVEGDRERQLAESIAPVIDAFAEAMGGKPMNKTEASRLRSNWRVTEARRHLFGRVMREERETDAIFWINDEDATLDALGERLARREGLSLEQLDSALQAVVKAYELARPALSALGAAHDRRAHTDHVTRGLADRFIAERASA